MPFKSGKSGNPKGRPKKGETITDLLREKVDGKASGAKVSRKERIIEKLIGLAESGDLAAMKYIFDRLDGRPAETMKFDHGGIEVRLLEILKYE
ncbi:MAG: DUF5681 domain-containing protein [Treponema sp.]|jgi:ribosomal protein L17|nr:DUF5681 domain-containing protein [Treponema sp.]